MEKRDSLTVEILPRGHLTEEKGGIRAASAEPKRLRPFGGDPHPTTRGQDRKGPAICKDRFERTIFKGPFHRAPTEKKEGGVPRRRPNGAETDRSWPVSL